MYIVDGIAYAGEQIKPLKVCGVRPMANYTLWVRFSNGEVRIADIKPLLKTPAFAPLADVELFNSVYIDYGIPVWMDGAIDIGSEYLYENSVPQDAASA
jgi:hypothetical protein